MVSHKYAERLEKQEMKRIEKLEKAEKRRICQEKIQNRINNRIAWRNAFTLFQRGYGEAYRNDTITMQEHERQKKINKEKFKAVFTPIIQFHQRKKFKDVLVQIEGRTPIFPKDLGGIEYQNLYNDIDEIINN